MTLRVPREFPKDLRDFSRWCAQADLGQIGTTSIVDNSVTLGKLAPVAGTSIVANMVNAVGTPSLVTAAANDRVLARVSDALTFTQLTAGMFPNTVVPDAALSANVSLKAAGSFTASLTGCTSVPTGSVSYLVNGNLAVLLIPTITATSNDVAATLTGAVVAVRPTTTQTFLLRITDNGTTAFGLGSIAASGVITLSVGAAAGAFTNSGTKGVQAFNACYALA